MSNASTRRLSHYFDLERGATYKSRLLDAPGPILLGLGTIARNGGFRSDSLRTYGGESPARMLVRAGELYVSLKDVTQSADLLGAVARLPMDRPAGRLTQDTVKLVPKSNDVPTDYLYWVLRSPEYRDYCRERATGTTNLGLPREDFLAFPVPEPSLERRELARLLTLLEDKVALNHRMSRALEGMAAALFEKWREDHETSMTVVRSESLIEQGVLLINDGYRAKNSAMADSGLPFARAGNLKIHFDFTGADLLGDSGVRAAREKVSRPFDCVFTSKGTVGRIAQVLPSTPRFVYSPQLCFWRSLRPEVLNPFVLSQWMNSEEFREQVDAVKGQTDMADYVSLRDQRRMQITLPLSADQRAIGTKLESLALLQDSHNAESATLGKLRDTLLSQLLSGAIRLREAECTVAAAL